MTKIDRWCVCTHTHTHTHTHSHTYTRTHTLKHTHTHTHTHRFLSKLEYIAVLSNDLSNYNTETIPKNMMLLAKKAGFSDKQLASRLGAKEMDVRRARQEMQITPVVKQIDTLAAEFPAQVYYTFSLSLSLSLFLSFSVYNITFYIIISQTNYLYMTYNGAENDVEFDDNGIMVIGC